MPHIVPKKQGKNTYYALQESYRGADGKVHTRHLRYLGKAGDLGNMNVTQVRDLHTWGGVRAALSLAEVLNIGKVADATLPKGGGPGAGDLLTILAINRLLEPCSKSGIEAWYSSTALEEMIGLAASKLSAQNLCAFLDYLTDDRVQRMEEAWASLLEKKFGMDMDSIIFDITSVYTYGSIEGLSAHGHSRDHRPDLEQVNIGLAVTWPHYIPTMHRVFEGDVPDVVTLPSTATALRSRSDRRITLVYDRGFLSAENIRMLDGLKEFDFICGAKWTNETTAIVDEVTASSLLKPLRKRAKDDLLTSCELVRPVYGRQRKVFIYHSTAKTVSDKAIRERRVRAAEEELERLRSSVEVRCKDHDMLVVALHKATEGVKSFFDVDIEDHEPLNDVTIVKKPGLDVDLRKLRWVEERLPAFIQSLQGRELKNRELRKLINDELGDLRKYYEVKVEQHQRRSTFTCAVNEEAVQAAAAYDGFFMLLSSNRQHTAGEVLDVYTTKDGVEKAFGTIKNPIAIAPIYHWTAQRVKGHVLRLLCVVSHLRLRQVPAPPGRQV